MGLARLFDILGVKQEIATKEIKGEKRCVRIGIATGINSLTLILRLLQVRQPVRDFAWDRRFTGTDLARELLFLVFCDETAAGEAA